MSTATQMGPRKALLDRLAAAPISWGVCEVPGWGVQLPPETVLAQMHSLGVVATEAGPDGYLGGEPAQVRALLERSGLGLVGGFLPVVLHDAERLPASLAKVRRAAALFAELGAHVLCTAVVVDDGWSPRVELSEAEWDQLLAAFPLVDAAAAEHGVIQALHPHWGTLIERDADLQRLLAGSQVRLCLDTGHLALGGADALDVARRHPSRVAHVHLKDVDAALARRLRGGEIAFVEAVQAGLFSPLGTGDARIREVVSALEAAGYSGWYVLEQDISLDTRGGEEPAEAVRHSIEFLRQLAATTNGG